jgi:hypothetical protein
MRARESATEADNRAPYVSIACRLKSHAQCPHARPVQRHVQPGVTYEVCTCPCHDAVRSASGRKEER